MELIEFGILTAEQYAELVGDEEDPWDAGDVHLEWRPKDRHVGLCAPDGRLVATAGMTLVTVRFGGGETVPVVGLGGVIVAAPFRGRGFGRRVITEALARAREMGPAIAMLFCRPDRAGLYRQHGFAEMPGPVLVDQPGAVIEIADVTMWRPLRPGAALPRGPVKLDGLPF